MEAACWTATLRVSERLLAIPGVRRIALHPTVVDAANFDDRRTLLDLLYCSLLPRFVIGIERPVSFYAVDFNGVVAAGALVILAIGVVDGASLAGYSHNLRLVSRAFKIRIGILQLGLLTSLIFGVLVYFQVRWRAAIARVKFFFFVASRGIVLILGLGGIMVVLQARLWLTGTLSVRRLYRAHVVVPRLHVRELRQE